MIIDISPPISPAVAVWPGDTPPTRDVLMDMRRGDNLTLSTLRSTVHLGAHVDAPSHYGAEAPSIESVPLDRCIGRCKVVSVRVGRGERVGTSILQAAVGVERVLFRTGTFPHPETFNDDFAGIEPELINALADAEVRLVGIDTPSVDSFSSKDLPAHRACLARDVVILEGLVLDEVPDGMYELIALPLRLVGFDASPVRAVLRPVPPPTRS